MTYTPTGGNSSKKRKTFITTSKGSKFEFNNLDSSLALDLWYKFIDDYLGTEAETVYNTPTVNLHSDLDQPRSTVTSQTNTQTTVILPTVTVDDPIRVLRRSQWKHQRARYPQNFVYEEIQAPQNSMAIDGLSTK